MPCNDITENLVLTLSHEYAIQSYALRKRTCGARVGNQSLLLDWARKVDPKALLTMEMDTFLMSYDTSSLSEYDKFIALKHFDTLKKGLSILLGKEGGTKFNDVTVDLIEYTSNTIDVRMFVGINIDATSNPGCGSGGCGGGCSKK